MDSKTQNNINDSNYVVMLIIGVMAILYLLLTCLPALVIGSILIIIFNKVKINKLIFTLLGLIISVLVNIKLSFVENYLIHSFELCQDILNLMIHKNNPSFIDIYKDYLLHTNYIWQTLISIIIASIFSYFIMKNSEEEKEAKEEKKELKVKKALEKLKKYDNESTIIGVDYDNLEGIKVHDNTGHILIGGTTGAGKTVTISNFIENCIKKDYPVLAVDGKGDTKERSLLHYMQDLSRKYNKKLYVINFVNPEYSDFYNPFKNAGLTEAKDMLISMNEWTEPHYKINTERYLQQLIKVLKLANITLDLNTIIKYSPSQFKLLIEELKDNKVLEIEEYIKINDIIENSDSIINSAMARFATTAESEAGEIFNNKGIDILTAMQEKANILIILDSLGKPEMSKQVGRLAVLDAKKAVSKMFGDNTRKFFIFDEFNVYISDIAIDLLNKSRSANVTCIPAFQSLSDIDKAGGIPLRNQLIENCNNYIVMRQNSPDSSNIWEKVIGQEETTNYTYSMKETNGILNNKNKTTGTGSMSKIMKSKYDSSKIQALRKLQCIFLSKDQRITKKVKVKFVNLSTQEPTFELRKNSILKKKKNYTDSTNKKDNNLDFSGIEDILN